MATTNLNLELPTVSVTLGPTWATEINAAFEVIDAHDHTSGKGVQVPTAGLNINAELDFNNNKVSDLFSSQYRSNSTALTGSANANSLSVTSGNLYYTNSAGIAVQITDGSGFASSAIAFSAYEYQAVSSDLPIGAGDTFVFLAVDTTASRTITLPLANAVSSGRVYIIKDISGSANTNNIIVDISGSDTVDGASSQTLNSNYGSWQIVGDGVDKWYIA